MTFKNLKVAFYILYHFLLCKTFLVLIQPSSSPTVLLPSLHQPLPPSLPSLYIVPSAHLEHCHYCCGEGIEVCRRSAIFKIKPSREKEKTNGRERWKKGERQKTQRGRETKSMKVKRGNPNEKDLTGTTLFFCISKRLLKK